MPAISKEEYEPMKAFFIAWMERFPITIDLPPEHHPVAMLEKLEKMGMSKARLGLSAAVNDTLEWASDLPASEIEDIDRDFSARGLPTISSLLSRRSRKRRK